MVEMRMVKTILMSEAEMRNMLLDNKLKVLFVIRGLGHPDWYSSVAGAPPCTTKCHRPDSQSGYMPGLWAMSPIGGMKEANK